MTIRKAKKEESQKIAPLIFLAMEDIAYNFAGEKSKDKAIQFLESLIKEKNNQYSYENCWVAETQEAIAGMAVIYNGAHLASLRKPVTEKVMSMFSRSFELEDETQAGEYYIDCISVAPDHQGKGIGSKILLFLIEEYVHKHHETLGLLVDKDNPNAKRLYVKLGFEPVDEKIIAGKEMEHLQLTYEKATLFED
ncbi:GNAT family N-acetyltransferase [Robertkochia solimangrovi]|nr:GNAT family N-acetyltransferase [Robertkochia solimangrovi]